MSYSTNINDYPHLQNPALINGITDTNAEILKRYVNRQRLKGAMLQTIELELKVIALWCKVIGTDKLITNWTTDDIETAYLELTDRIAAGTRSRSTVVYDVFVVLKLWQYLHPDAQQPDIKIKPVKKVLSSSDYITTEQILKMRDTAEQKGNIRDAALIMTLLGTGCRISELLDANIEDVAINRQYAIITVTGKTGTRRIPFVTGLPELQRWINSHPIRNPDGTVDTKAPLITTYGTRGNPIKRLSYTQAHDILKLYATKIGLSGVKFNPHAFRHRAASDDAHHLTTKELCLKFGWTPYSNMPARYTHTNEEELTAAILDAAGVSIPNQVKADTKTTIQCPRCHSINRAGALYCDTCSLPLDAAFARELMEIEKGNQEYILELMKKKGE